MQYKRLHEIADGVYNTHMPNYVIASLENELNFVVIKPAHKQQQ
jgi:hypothetical protein